MCYKESKSTPFVHVNFLIIKAKLIGQCSKYFNKRYKYFTYLEGKNDHSFKA